MQEKKKKFMGVSDIDNSGFSTWTLPFKGDVSSEEFELQVGDCIPSPIMFMHKFSKNIEMNDQQAIFRVLEII